MTRRRLVTKTPKKLAAAFLKLKEIPLLSNHQENYPLLLKLPPPRHLLLLLLLLPLPLQLPRLHPPHLPPLLLPPPLRLYRLPSHLIAPLLLILHFPRLHLPLLLQPMSSSLMIGVVVVMVKVLILMKIIGKLVKLMQLLNPKD